jgi:hypothetical protein
MASNRASLALGELDAFVDMMAAATGLPCWKLEGWLEIYWKLRVLDVLEEDERRSAEAEAVELLPEPEAPSGPAEPEAPAQPRTLSGNGARSKREIFQRLTAARSSGVTVAQIVAASRGGLRVSEILTAINCEHLHISKWTAIGKALVTLGY